MNIYQFQANCDLCGEPGPCNLNTYAAAYAYGLGVRCKNRERCSENIRLKKEAVRIEELENKSVGAQ